MTYLRVLACVAVFGMLGCGKPKPPKREIPISYMCPTSSCAVSEMVAFNGDHIAAYCCRMDNKGVKQWSTYAPSCYTDQRNICEEIKQEKAHWFGCGQGKVDSPCPKQPK